MAVSKKGMDLYLDKIEDIIRRPTDEFLDNDVNMTGAELRYMLRVALSFKEERGWMIRTDSHIDILEAFARCVKVQRKKFWDRLQARISEELSHG